MNEFFEQIDSIEYVKPKKVKIIKNYLIGDVLGDGSYAKVKECLDMETLARRAVKIINLKMVARKIPKGVENVRNEIKIMEKLNHKNLIKLYATFEKDTLNTNSNNNNNNNKSLNPINDQNKQENQDFIFKTTAQMIYNLEKPPKLYIFMDYCLTSLEKLLKNAPCERLTNYQANYYFKQLIDGLEYLHSINIIHNDIKPGNLLITCDDVLKICDFNISANLNLFSEHEYLKSRNQEEEEQQQEEQNEEQEKDQMSVSQQITTEEYETSCGINLNFLTNSNQCKFPIQQCTPMFQCPEMLDETIDELLIIKNAPKIDIWSSGITLYQLTTGTLPFQGQTIHQIFEMIRSDSVDIEIPDFIDKNLRVLLNGMLTRDINKRWSIKQIKDSEWFNKKHPIVREEIAPLPQDVVQNELSTFRMLDYLEIYCNENLENKKNSNIYNYLNIFNTEHNNISESFVNKTKNKKKPKKYFLKQKLCALL